MIPEVEQIFKSAAPYMKGVLRFLFVNIWLFKPLIVWLLPKMSPYGRALLSTTIAFTMSKGSEQANVIPSEAYVIANLRTHPIQNVKESFEVIQSIALKYDVEAELLEHREASPMTDISGDAYHYLNQIIKQVFPDVELSKMHGHNESIKISTLVEAVRFYQTIIKNIH